MHRVYESIIEHHFRHHDQMLFIAGPRQVGKTTVAQGGLVDTCIYLNFDIEEDRHIIMSGPEAVAEHAGLSTLNAGKQRLILDEFHKYKHWKQFLKGFYDKYKMRVEVLVTGSAKLDIFQKGGDSLLGRYLLYRMHPISLAEILGQDIPEQLTISPKKLASKQFEDLYNFGGFPDPFLKHDERFANQWRRLRRQQLLQEDIRTLTQLNDITHIEMLATLLRDQVGQQLVYSNLSKALKVSVDSIRRWLVVLEEFYYCFRLQPWHSNVKRSLVKEPKVFVWDWSEIQDEGARFENMIASHLLKAVHFWTDSGFGEFELCYLRDKDKREVDFVVIKNGAPWFLVECKLSGKGSISEHLYYFHKQLGTKHAFQVVLKKGYVDKDCFAETDPVVVPALTFLSQLI